MAVEIKNLRSIVTLTDEQLRAIGCVAVESAYFDDMLDMFIEQLCCLDEHDFRVLTAGAQLQAKLNVLKDVTRSRIDDKLADKHGKIFGKAAHVISERNNVIHGSWSVERIKGVKANPDGTFRWEAEGATWARRKKRGEIGSTLFKPKNIMDTAIRLAEVVTELAHFLFENGLWPAQYVRSLRPPPVQVQIRNSASKTTGRDPGPPKDQE